MKAASRFVLTLQPLPGVDAIRSLRWVLKGLLRQHGMRCVDLREEKPSECGTGFQSLEPVRAADQPVLINELIERAEPPSENFRQYLGASAIGSECLRKVQYDWMCDPVVPGAHQGHFRARALFRRRDAPAPGCRRVQVRTA